MVDTQQRTTEVVITAGGPCSSNNGTTGTWVIIRVAIDQSTQCFDGEEIVYPIAGEKKNITLLKGDNAGIHIEAGVHAHGADQIILFGGNTRRVIPGQLG